RPQGCAPTYWVAAVSTAGAGCLNRHKKAEACALPAPQASIGFIMPAGAVAGIRCPYDFSLRQMADMTFSERLAANCP
ncbi:MAG: hypothetical protein WA029_16540, partial [Anaerolineae bacterium]